MTEDDTFNKLRRLPFEEVKRLWLDNHGNYEDNGVELVIKAGWDPHEFVEAWYGGQDLLPVKKNIVRQIFDKFKNEIISRYRVHRPQT